MYFNFSEDLTTVEPWSKSNWSQTDLPRLRKGMVGAQVSLRVYSYCYYLFRTLGKMYTGGNGYKVIASFSRVDLGDRAYFINPLRLTFRPDGNRSRFRSLRVSPPIIIKRISTGRRGQKSSHVVGWWWGYNRLWNKSGKSRLWKRAAVAFAAAADSLVAQTLWKFNLSTSTVQLTRRSYDFVFFLIIHSIR